MHAYTLARTRPVQADDFGHNDIGYADPTVKTPCLDALASEGVILTSHYTWNWCAPSRGALLTGIYAPRNGYALNASGGDSGSPSGLPLNWTLVPALLRAGAGYTTVGVGKWHL